MNKKFLVLAGVTIISSMILSGCNEDNKSYAGQNCPIEFVSYKGDFLSKKNSFDVSEIKNKETGKRYYLLENYYGVALMPIDDQPITKEDNKKKELEKINKQMKELENKKKQLEE